VAYGVYILSPTLLSEISIVDISITNVSSSSDFGCSLGDSQAYGIYIGNLRDQGGAQVSLFNGMISDIHTFGLGFSF
jgi:hypothetical protein